MGIWAPERNRPAPARLADRDGRLLSQAHTTLLAAQSNMAGAGGRGMEDPMRLRWSSDTLRVSRVLAEEVIGERGAAGRRRPLRAARRRR
jgi:hypothetical protein